MRVINVHGKTLALFVFGLATTLAQAATPPNTAIVNTATASYQVSGTPVTSTGSVTTTTSARTPATIEFLQYVPGGTVGSVEQVGTSSCSGVPLPDPNYIFPPLSTLAVPGALRLAPATHYSGGDPLFVRVTDHDQNLNAAAVENITVTLTSPAGDTETITLSETGPSTGVFIGYQQLKQPQKQLRAVGGEPEHYCTYRSADAVPTVTDGARGSVRRTVDSSSGATVNGAAVTPVNDLTGLPGLPDGVTALAQPIISGTATTCDSVMPPGGYRFPRVAPGTYRIAVAPPVAYGFPSSVAPASLPGGFTVIGSPGNGASYGTAFVLNPGPAVKIDVPLDPAGGNLQIIKTAGKPVIGIGDFLPYTLSIRNNAANATANRSTTACHRASATSGSARLAAWPTGDFS
jgi:hypothetical protein